MLCLSKRVIIFLAIAAHSATVHKHHHHKPHGLITETMLNFEQRPEDSKVVAGERLTLSCGLTGTPTGHIHWTKDGIKIQGGSTERLDSKPNEDRLVSESGITKSVFVVNCAGEDDAGTYECHGANGVTEIRSSAKVTIVSSESESESDNCNSASTYPPTITEWTMIRLERIGNFAHLQCRTDQPAKFSWTFGGNLIDTADGHFTLLENGDLLVKDLVVANQGIYECTAFNGNGESTQEVVENRIIDYSTRTIGKGEVLQFDPSLRGETSVSAYRSHSSEHEPFALSPGSIDRRQRPHVLVAKLYISRNSK
ncbi:unnamed protein product [Caenorhabditis sp. 36 PRJEB53466]|nr:unnamed protein product [Caenorhabditis sp. 36 PRJEB53466]